MKMGLNPLVKMKRDGDMGSEPHTYLYTGSHSELKICTTRTKY